MKIYHKNYFVFGFISLCALPLFALNIIKADWWQWGITLAISAKFLYVGLSKPESEQQSRIEKNYRRVSQELYGKYAVVKTNLPLVILVAFFTITLFIRLVFNIVIPACIVVCFLIVLTVSVFYSIGLDRKIKEHIDNDTN
ncbi:hypothetical protein [Clostridium transplantifaecale]|uniref:hypothetical protein n=1 Tax=Clostridium transplantifaecale TaxID=2479838 RepID=UPI000F639030|nr:hypothetical protein [Clostridium transplantifaecale]